MLDNKDNKILSIISNNARTPSNGLSKTAHLSREVIDYHIKRLEKEKIIIGYQARLNINAFSILRYNLLIKLNKYDKIKEEELIKHLKKQKYTHYIAKIGGNFDFIIGFSIKEVTDLKVYLDLLYGKFSDLISIHQLFTQLDEIKDDFATLFGKGNNLSYVSMRDFNKDFKLDNTNKKILQEITKNSKISSVDLGNMLNLTSAAIAYRIKNMEKNNIILGYRTIIDILKLSKQFYYVFFDVKTTNIETEKIVFNQMKSNPNILFANRLAGTHSYLCMIYAKNNNDFYEKLRELQNNLNTITNIEIYSILDFIHQNYIPKGFLD